jgi:hypothetical protein
MHTSERDAYSRYRKLATFTRYVKKCGGTMLDPVDASESKVDAKLDKEIRGQEQRETKAIQEKVKDLKENELFEMKTQLARDRVHTKMSKLEKLIHFSLSYPGAPRTVKAMSEVMRMRTQIENTCLWLNKNMDIDQIRAYQGDAPDNKAGMYHNVNRYSLWKQFALLNELNKRYFHSTNVESEYIPWSPSDEDLASATRYLRQRYAVCDCNPTKPEGFSLLTRNNRPCLLGTNTLTAYMLRSAYNKLCKRLTLREFKANKSRRRDNISYYKHEWVKITNDVVANDAIQHSTLWFKTQRDRIDEGQYTMQMAYETRAKMLAQSL